MYEKDYLISNNEFCSRSQSSLKQSSLQALASDEDNIQKENIFPEMYQIYIFQSVLKTAGDLFDMVNQWLNRKCVIAKTFVQNIW